MGSKGTQQTTQQTSPNTAAMTAYNAALTQAQGLQPYQVAPINQQQQMGINTINTSPSLTYAAAQPINQNQIQYYENPYTAAVTQATEQQFENTNAQALNNVTGNAAAQGALGGNRVGVAQALTEGQLETQEAPVIAGLQMQGYTTGLQTALQEQANLAAQGAQLGTIGQTQVGAGTLEQQTQQLGYLAPYQTEQLQAGLETGIGSEMGGTATTTYPAPSILQQIGGVGLGGLGILGGTGAFGSSGYLNPSGVNSQGQSTFSDRRLKEGIHKIGETNDGQPIYRFRYKGDPVWRIGLIAQDVEKKHPEAVRHFGEYKAIDIKEATDDSAHWAGGRVAGFAFGGAPLTPPSVTGAPNYLVAPQLGRGPGPPRPPAPYQPQSPMQMLQNAASLAKAFGSGSRGPTAGAPTNSAPPAPSTTPIPALGNSFDTSSDYALHKYGGLVLPKHNRIELKRGVRTGFGLPAFFRGGFADGGTPTDSPLDQRFGSSQGYGGVNPHLNVLEASALYGQESPYIPQQTSLPPGPHPIAGQAPSSPTSASAVPPAIGQSGAAPLAYSAPSGLAPSAPYSAADFVPPSTPSRPQDLWTALAATGFGMAASRAPQFGVALGEGGLQGIHALGEMRQQELAEQKQAQDVDLRVKQLNQQAKAEQDRIALESRRYSEMTAGEKAELGIKEATLAMQQQQPVVVGQDVLGRNIYATKNLKTGELTPIDLSKLSPSGTNAENALGQPKIGQLPAVAENIAQKMANYEYPAPSSGFAMGKPAVQAMVARAVELNPNFDVTNYNAKNKAVSAFATGKQGDQVRFWNNASQHFNTLDNLITALGNGDVQAVNSIKNYFKTQFGYEAPTDFNAAKNVVGQEIVKAIVANGGGEHEREEAARSLATANSPEQLRGVLNTYRELGGAQLRDLEKQYEASTGLHNFSQKYLIPESQAELQRVQQRTAAPTTAQPAATAATPPVPGAKLYQGKWYTRGPNGEAVPVQ